MSRNRIAVVVSVLAVAAVTVISSPAVAHTVTTRLPSVRAVDARTDFPIKRFTYLKPAVAPHKVVANRQKAIEIVNKIHEIKSAIDEAQALFDLGAVDVDIASTLVLGPGALEEKRHELEQVNASETDPTEMISFGMFGGEGFSQPLSSPETL